MKIRLKDNKELQLPEGDGKTEEAKVEVSARYFADAILNNGVTPEGDRIPVNLKDLVSTTEMQALLARTTEIVIREPIEPILAISGLYTPIRAKGMETKIILGAMGALHAGEADEGGNYPEANFDIGGGITISTVGKSGIQASFSDESLRYTTWDIMAITLRLMAAAVARHSELKAIRFLRSMGQIVYDNASPTRSIFGVMTGRNMDGTPNGALTMEDIMNAYTHMVTTGFTPDVLIMSPQMYFMWVRDPVLRNLFHQGQGGVYFATYNGNPGVRPNWGNGSLGGRGPSNGFEIIPAGNAAGETPTGELGYSQHANSSPNIPSYLGLPLRVIVSPLIPYDPATKLGDVILACSGMIGYRIIDEDLSSVEWRDEDRELVKVKMKQRDSYAVAFDGKGICVFKNVHNVQNHFSGQVQLTQTVSGTITEIDSDVAVV